MRASRVVLALVSVLALPVAADAQSPSAATVASRWNDSVTMDLVRAATARRALQLADTGLRDYTARATGYLTFLAQFGEGFRTPPLLVKSDQIAVEVYWGAPDRSKQRVVGRRDTLLLPTDQSYHRDHLGIIQNNFPEMIRLGDGDEVRDVPHPLSALGQATYDYRISDSMAIRTSGLAIDVMMISLRPKDDRAAAAVGAVYLDRSTASVVRLTLSFTRAALLDERLEDVSVILENGLVDGRFWLPRRQEIEIRRQVTWLDWPARGIIRGRWEICCVVANASPPPEVFLGPEITFAPPNELTAYPFPGEVLDELPDEVRALDAAEVRAVQEEARELVRANALARARGAAFASRGISEFVAFDRTQGLSLGAGVTQRLGWGVSAGARARYGLADERAKGAALLTWRSARGHALRFTVFDEFAMVGDVAEVSGLRNSIAAQEFGSDWIDQMRVRGYGVRLERQLRSGALFTVEHRYQREDPLAVRTAPASGAFAPTFAADSLSRASLALGYERRWSVARGAGSVRAAVGVSGALVNSAAPALGDIAITDPGVGRTSLQLDVSLPAGRGVLVAQTLAGAVWEAAGAAPEIPAQDALILGGPVTGPGLGFHALAGRSALSQRLEYQSRIPFLPITLGRFGRVPSSLTLAPYVHGVWLGRPLRGEQGWHPAVGLGVIGLFDVFRLDVARGLRDGRWMFSLDASREFWPVL
jgi:hypothetical protein